MTGDIERTDVGRLAADLASLAPRRPTPDGRHGRVIGIDGWSGSGKTSLGVEVAAGLGVACIHLDDWVPGWEGLNRSVELLVEWVLVPLSEGRPAAWRRWDWVAGRFGEAVTVAPAGFVVVEGCGVGSAAVRPWLSALVWLDTDDRERARRLRERPDWVTYAPWVTTWSDQERALRAGEDPAATADAVVDGGDSNGRLRVRWRRDACSGATGSGATAGGPTGSGRS